MKSVGEWAVILRKLRLSLGLSQGELAGAISSRLGDLTQEDRRDLAKLGIDVNPQIHANLISRYETAKRVPSNRNRHLVLVWIFTRLGSKFLRREVDDWLAFAGQGRLTSEESTILLGEDNRKRQQDDIVNDESRTLKNIVNELNTNLIETIKRLDEISTNMKL